jgi:hypothetical protein
MAIYIGGTELNSLFSGGTQIQKVYSGADEVWSDSNFDLVGADGDFVLATLTDRGWIQGEWDAGGSGSWTDTTDSSALNTTSMEVTCHTTDRNGGIRRQVSEVNSGVTNTVRVVIANNVADTGASLVVDGVTEGTYTGGADGTQDFTFTPGSSTVDIMVVGARVSGGGARNIDFTSILLNP